MGRTPREKFHYVIIGNSAAGLAAAREIRRRDGNGRITMISDEPTYGYSRVMLPLYIAGKVRLQDLLIAPRSFYPQLGVRLLRNEAVESIDPQGQRIRTSGKKILSYDRLLIATGAAPRMPEIPGITLPGVYPLRTLAETRAIRARLSSTRGPVLIWGGGLVGVKSLEAFIVRRREIHLVVSSGRILSQMLDPAASSLFLKALAGSGVKVHLQRDVRAFHGREGLESAELSDGTVLPCTLAIIGKGVTPNIGLVEGTECARKQGLVVDSRMATNLPGIYAAGDVAEPPSLFPGDGGSAIWPLAVEGGRTAGANMAGAPSVFQGGLRMNAVEFLGTRVISAGEWRGGRALHAVREGGSVYRKLSFAEGQLTGFILAGDVRCAGVLTALIRNRTRVSQAVLEEGLDRGFSYWPRLRSMEGQMSDEGRSRA
jgi:nitrite reductase (NADH) large subunit